MKKKIQKIALPIGLLALIATYILTRFTVVSTGTRDFLWVVGLALIIGALLFQPKWKRNS